MGEGSQARRWPPETAHRTRSSWRAQGSLDWLAENFQLPALPPAPVFRSPALFGPQIFLFGDGEKALRSQSTENGPGHSRSGWLPASCQRKIRRPRAEGNSGVELQHRSEFSPSEGNRRAPRATRSSRPQVRSASEIDAGCCMRVLARETPLDRRSQPTRTENNAAGVPRASCR